jgi:hypothetical protein
VEGADKVEGADEVEGVDKVKGADKGGVGDEVTILLILLPSSFKLT